MMPDHDAEARQAAPGSRRKDWARRLDLAARVLPLLAVGLMGWSSYNTFQANKLLLRTVKSDQSVIWQYQQQLNTCNARSTQFSADRVPVSLAVSPVSPVSGIEKDL